MRARAALPEAQDVIWRERLGFNFFEFEQCCEFVVADESHEVKPDEFHVAFGGPPAGETCEQQPGDQRRVDLNGDPGGRLSKQVAAARDTLEPLKKEFDLPAVAVNESDEFGCDLQVGSEQQAMVVDLDSNYAAGSSFPLGAQFDESLPSHAGITVGVGDL